jgi:ABC-type phosphate/phosphonate transport system substrate-binding protein
VSGLGGPHVELGMYPFASVSWAWDEIWAAVHRRAPWTPASLTRSGDVHARWYDPDCVVTQVCGYPFASLHRNDMHLVGAFALDIPEADGAYYRSVLLSPHERTIGQLVSSDSHAVANSADSLSGWLSLLAATCGPGVGWPGQVTFTSAHRDSLLALAKGEADIASIDPWTLAFVAAEEPELVAPLHRLGLGPRVPTPAITARRTVTPRQLTDLRRAFHEVLDDEATASARRALYITGFVDHDLDIYLATLPLGSVR